MENMIGNLSSDASKQAEKLCARCDLVSFTNNVSLWVNKVISITMSPIYGSEYAKSRDIASNGNDASTHCAVAIY